MVSEARWFLVRCTMVMIPLMAAVPRRIFLTICDIRRELAPLLETYQDLFSPRNLLLMWSVLCRRQSSSTARRVHFERDPPIFFRVFLTTLREIGLLPLLSVFFIRVALLV
jgi:hypothetical protein